MKRVGKKIVEKLIKEEGEILNTSVLNRTIKNYILERREELGIDEDDEDISSFRQNNLVRFDDMSIEIGNIITELTNIKGVEGNILIGADEYSEEFLQSIIERLEGVVDDLEFLRDL